MQSSVDAFNRLTLSVESRIPIYSEGQKAPKLAPPSGLTYVNINITDSKWVIPAVDVQEKWFLEESLFGQIALKV